MAVVIVAAGLMAACNEQPDPYLSKTDTRGTPSDRTGGATMPSTSETGGTTPAPGR